MKLQMHPEPQHELVFVKRRTEGLGEPAAIARESLRIHGLLAHAPHLPEIYELSPPEGEGRPDDLKAL